jgi:hypothetical protein
VHLGHPVLARYFHLDPVLSLAQVHVGCNLAT